MKGGYQPATIYGRVGEPLRIVFFREESASCSEHVVFPGFGKSAMLPPFEDVTLELVPQHAGEYEFTCQLGMLRGRLVVLDRAGSQETPRATGFRGARPTRTSVTEPGDTALVALVAWICGVLLLLLVSVPLVGWRAGGLLALAWLALVAGACFARCVRRVNSPGAHPSR